MDREPHLNIFANVPDDDCQTAEYLAHQMLHLKTKMLGRNYPGCCTDLYNLGLLNLALDDYYRAKKFLVRALQLQKSEGRQQDIIQTLKTLARLHKKEKPSIILEKAC